MGHPAAYKVYNEHQRQGRLELKGNQSYFSMVTNHESPIQLMADLRLSIA